MNKPRSSAEKRASQLPTWLWSNSNALPLVYRRIWEAVKEERPGLGANQGEPLVETKKVFPLLLTSQLPTEVLGYIWSLANQKYAGKLTEQELYVVLALVAVAQTSYPFTNLEVLHLLPGPPTPRLNLSLVCPNAVQSPAQQPEAAIHQEDAAKPEVYARSAFKASPASSGIAPPVLPGLIPNHSHLGETRIDSKIQSPVSTSAKIGSNESSSEHRQISGEMRAAAHSSSSVDSSDDFSEFQSAPMTQATQSIPILDSKLGSAIGSRLANHNLGVKKSSERPKRIAGGGSSKIHSGSQIRPGGAFTVVPSTISVAVFGGKESGAPNERLGDLFPKCSLKSQAKTVILKDTVIRSNDPPKQSVPVNPGESTAIERIEIPPPTRSAPKFVSSGKDTGNSAQDLMNLQQVEDRYSALRILVEEPDPVQRPLDVNSAAPNALSQSDDFGDFVSAEQPQSFAGSTAVASANFTLEPDNSNDIFTEFESFRPQSVAAKKPEAILNFDDTREGPSNPRIGAAADDQFLDEKYDVNVETERVVQKEDTISVNSIDIGNGMIGVMTRSNSVPSLDLKSFLSPSVEDEQQQIENMHQLIYWEWKQYMESCVLLLQTAANAFGSITSDAVLQEILASAQGYNFLCNLAEVAAVCRRVNFSHKEMDINIMGFDDLLMDIDRIWAEMEPFYANIPIVSELPVWPLHQSESTNCCALCLTVVTSGRIIYNDNSYHVTCANLWLNCVNNNLPALRYPPSSFVPHSVPIASTGNS